MALGLMEFDDGVSSPSTGITGISASKSGNIVTLSIATSATTQSSTGWVTLGTLNADVRPKNNLYALGFNNSATTVAKAPLVFVVATTGVVQYYVYSDQTGQIVPRGTITYLTNS